MSRNELMNSMIMYIGLGCILNSCTYSITMVHTQGMASDVVDETQRADPDVKADVSIPAI